MRDIPTSPRVLEIKRARKKARVRSFVIFGIFFVLIVVGLSFLSSWGKITINKTNINGAHIIREDEILKIVNNDLSGKYFYLFSKNNYFIYPKTKIENDLLKNFTRIEKLSIKDSKVDTLEISLTERSGSFLWCGESVPTVFEDIGENCYFINNDGYIFDRAPYYSGNLYFKFYLPIEMEGNSPLGKQMLSKNEFISIVEFIDKINSLGLKSIYLVFNQDGTRDLFLEKKSPSTNNPKIIFYTDGDNGNLIRLAENLSLAMAKSEFAEEIKNNYNKLLYIDLKFKNKVLYKFE